MSGPTPPTAPAPPSAEAQQEALLKASSAARRELFGQHPARRQARPTPPPRPAAAPQAKYGGLLPKKKMLKGAAQGYFDSADWQMGKQKGLPTPPPLRPKLAPAAAPLSPERRPSQLGDGLA